MVLGEVIIAVADTGLGIVDEVREKVFNPFVTTKELGKGTGLGLTIVRSIVVDRHGGAVSFLTERGRGTTFTVRLPSGSPSARCLARARPKSRGLHDRRFSLARNARLRTARTAHRVDLQTGRSLLWSLDDGRARELVASGPHEPFGWAPVVASAVYLAGARSRDGVARSS